MVLAMLIPSLALAMQLTTSNVGKGSALYSQCKTHIALIEKTKEIDTGSAVDAGVCIGFLTGFVEAARERFGFCVKDTTINTLARVYVAYMDKNPKLFDENEGITVSLALVDAYPCPK
jgi:hypothetical protein